MTAAVTITVTGSLDTSHVMATMIVRADYYYFFLLHVSHLNVVRHNNYVTVAYFVQTGESRQTVLTSASNHVTMSVTKKRTSKYGEYI